jgi:MFS family permease
MRDALRSVFVLFMAISLLMAGTGPLTTLIGVRLEASRESTLVIGIVMAAYFAGLTIGSLQTFRLVTRIGHIRAFAAFSAGIAASTLAYPVIPDPWFWGLLRLVQGFCMAGLFVCIESWLNDSATTRTRGTILAAYMTFLYLAQAAGQFILRIPDETGFLLFVMMGILLCLAALPVAVTRMAPPVLPDVASLSFKRLYAASPLGIFGCISSGLILGAVYSLMPVYASGIGFDLSQTATLMSALIFGGVLLQWPLGLLSDLLDRRKVIVGVIAAGALTSVAMIGASVAGELVLMLLAAIFGGISFVLYPLCVAHTNDHLSREERIGASGGLVLSYSAGATVGPPIAAGVMNFAGPAGLFMFTAAVGIASIAFAVWRMNMRAPVPADQQGLFQTLPRTTPVAAPLDPRGEEDYAGPVAEDEDAIMDDEAQPLEKVEEPA